MLAINKVIELFLLCPGFITLKMEEKIAGQEGKNLY